MNRQLIRAFAEALLLHALLMGIPLLWLMPRKPTTTPLGFTLVQSSAQPSKKNPGLFPHPKSPAVKFPALSQAQSSNTMKQATGSENSTTSIAQSYTDQLIQTNAAPEYPRTSRIRKEEGHVKVRVTLEHQNNDPNEGLYPVSVTLERSSGFDLLDQASLNTVKRWKFPRLSQSVPLVILIPFHFSLKDRSD